MSYLIIIGPKVRFKLALSFLAIYIYERLRPRKKNPQQKKERVARAIFFNEIEHQTS